jgi:DNA-directed RNA polymerase subunit RPC12/RpoP
VDAERWLTSELASFACAACGQPYGEAHIRLIAQREELFFLDLSCPHCGSQAVAIVTIQFDGDAASIEGGELVRSARRGAPGADASPAISADDVLDVHALLGDFEGDVHQLIARFGGEAH